MAKKVGTTGLCVEEKKKIKVLLADGKTPFAVAREIGRDMKTVQKYAKTIYPEIVEERKKLGEIYEDVAHRMLGSISDQDITKINAQQRVISAAVATDKMRLLNDQSTENVAVLVDYIKELQIPRSG